MDALRTKLGLEETEAPWTNKPGVVLAMCPAQSSDYNFQNECLNLRFAKWCKAHGVSFEIAVSDVPDYLQTDIRQHVARHCFDG